MFLDPAVPREEGIVYAASKYSAQSILYLNIGLLGLIILTAGCDWRLTLLNRRLRMARLRCVCECRDPNDAFIQCQIQF
jgi:hypothetical protein